MGLELEGAGSTQQSQQQPWSGAGGGCVGEELTPTTDDALVLDDPLGEGLRGVEHRGRYMGCHVGKRSGRKRTREEGEEGEEK